MNNIKIKRALYEDANAITHLFHKYRSFYGYDGNIVQEKEFLQNRITNNEAVIFFADSKSEAVGFMQLYPLFSSTRMKKLWLLNDLYVDESSRGQGIAKALLQEAKTFSKQTGSCGFYLETAKTNTEANRLYLSSNLTLDEEHHYYYFEI